MRTCVTGSLQSRLLPVLAGDRFPSSSITSSHFLAAGWTPLPGQNATFSDRMAIAILLLLHPEDTLAKVPRPARGRNNRGGRRLYGEYNKPQGFWGSTAAHLHRSSSLIKPSPIKVSAFGLLPIQVTLLNAIPRVLWPNKPDVIFGNIYAREIGGAITDEDTNTGISFQSHIRGTSSGEMDRGPGHRPPPWFLMFTVHDSLFGDLRTAPWGLLAMAMISHTAPEGGITGVVYLFTFGVEIFAFCAFFATWVAPIFAIPVLGPDRRGTIQVSL